MELLIRILALLAVGLIFGFILCLHGRSEKLARHIRRGVVVLVYIGCAATIFAGIVVCTALPYALFPEDVTGKTVDDPGAAFTQLTGMQWPQSARVVSVGDSHGGLHGDGEFYVVFDADRATLESWLASAPPWGQEAWQRGPVPARIGYHCGFGAPGRLAMTTVNGGSGTYSGDADLIAVLGSTTVWYAALERCCETLHWHNGNLIVVDLETNRVWLSVWDF